MAYLNHISFVQFQSLFLKDLNKKIKLTNKTVKSANPLKKIKRKGSE